MKLYGTLILIGSIAGLVGVALTGNTIALVLVGALSAALFMTLGAALVIIFHRISNDAEQRRFRANELENLRIMQEAQKAQNLMLQGWARSQSAFPQPDNGSTFLIEDNIFSELD